jgi:sugar/nucleoside kinase (ribokinase family)
VSPRVVCVGPHIVDVLVRPVTTIPPGQGGARVEQLRITAAGTAAGTAVDLAKLGARVTSIGAIGDDTNGQLLRMLLEKHGVDASRLAVRPGLATSATVLPIRPNGERPALHLPGATATLTAADVDLDLVAAADAVHLGAPEALGPFTAGAGSRCCDTPGRTARPRRSTCSAPATTRPSSTGSATCSRWSTTSCPTTTSSAA